MEPIAGNEASSGARVDHANRTGLLTLVFTDLVGSTQLKVELGDRAGVALIQAHHTLVREILQSTGQAEEVRTAGDSFLISFRTPSEAVKFALRLQQRLQRFNQGQPKALQERIGLHLGEVVIDQSAERGAELYGMHVDTCARVMGMAQGGQILMTRAVFDSARQVLKGQDIDAAGPLRWVSHGWYLLKGIEEPVEICEVTELAQPLPPPATTEKAQKVFAETECVLGWRPAVEQVVPNTKWVLVEKLGEGGFGEVWKARHEKLDEHRVFKFCFRGDRVRSLKRELTLFRVLKERIGEHPNIVRLYDLYFDQPPFYLEEEYVSGKDLRSWCEGQGGVNRVPLATRLELVAQAAEALQAAHDAGVIHRDIKPGNILVESPAKSKGTPAGLRAKLSDFGIGQVVSQEYLTGITQAGFTQTIMVGAGSPKSGTQFYMAPELLSGKPASTRSDIYSLGIVLFQLLVEDFTRPLTADWESDISDDLLRDDLRLCVASKPEHRFAGAAQLARHLRDLERRHSELKEQQALAAARERAAYRRGIWRTGTVAAAVIAVLLLLAGYAIQQRREALTQYVAAQEASRQLAQTLRHSESLRAEDALKAGRSSQGLAMLAKFLRDDPADQIMANRVLSALTMRTFWLPIAEPLRHEGPVHMARFSADETKVVTASADKTARVWDVTTGQSLVPPLAHDGPVLTAEFSRDGERILTASIDGTARIWEARTGRLLSVLRHDGIVSGARFSPDGTRAVTASYDRTARIWDARSGQPIGSPLKHERGLTSAVFSPDGERIMTTSQDKTARLWNGRTGEPLSDPLPHESRPGSAEFSPDGKLVATDTWDGYLQFWDARTGQTKFKPIFVNNIIWRARFSPDSKRIAIAVGATARVWDVESGQPSSPSIAHDEQVSDVQFSPDGEMVVSTAGDGMARLWNATTGKILSQPIRHSGGLWGSRFTRDGKRLLTASQDGTARLWMLHKGGEPQVFTHTNTVFTACFSPDGARVLTGSGDRFAQLWDRASGQPIGLPMPHGDGLRHVAFSRDGSKVVTSAFDGCARIWDATTGRLLAGPLKHEGPVWYAEFSPDGQKLLTASLGGTARMWDVQTGKQLLEPVKYEVRVLAARFSPDGKRFVTGSQNRLARVWDAATGRPLTEPIRHPDSVFYALFSPDATMLLTVSGDSAWLWDAETGQRLLQRFKHDAQVRYAEFSPDGARVVTGSADGSARLWETRSGRPLGDTLRHDAKVETARFSPDGRRVVTASADETVRIWDVPSGRPLSEAYQADANVLSAEFDPTGTRVLAACSDWKARLWEAPTAPKAPPWLADLAECAAGETVPAGGGSVSVPPARVLALKRQLSQPGPRGFYEDWARWFFGVPTNATRSSAPR